MKGGSIMAIKRALSKATCQFAFVTRQLVSCRAQIQYRGEDLEVSVTYPMATGEVEACEATVVLLGVQMEAVDEHYYQRSKVQFAFST
jgi:hypothetical protein